MNLLNSEKREEINMIIFASLGIMIFLIAAFAIVKGAVEWVMTHTSKKD